LPERIAVAAGNAAKYLQGTYPILCTIGDYVWNDVVDKDYSTQIMVQQSVAKVK
jgi:hypothetical protein